METKNIYQKLFEVKKAWIKLQRDTTAFNYKYATLAQIQEKLSWEFEKQWLLVIHIIEDNKVVTSIVDIEDPVKYMLYSAIPLSEWIKPQDKWSEITYYRRYNLLSLLDLEVEDDDWKKAQESKPKYEEDDTKEWFNDEHYDKIVDSISEWKSYTIKQIRDKYKVSRDFASRLKGLWVI